MDVIPFEPDHLNQLELQQAQAYLGSWVTSEQGAALAEHPSYTAIQDGTLLASAGVVTMWQGRAMAWAFLTDMGAQHFIGVHRAVKRFIDGCYYQRIEMTVDCDFEAAHHWAKMLGFTMEAERMRAYAPDGHDCSLYARVL